MTREESLEYKGEKMARNIVCRCMGDERYRSQCKTCKRYPRTVEEENKANAWYDVSGRNETCGEYQPTTDGKENWDDNYQPTEA
jgi:hypothetical protein